MKYLSISQVKLFKACRRAYQLKYIEGLELVQKADALETGSNYHELLEQLYNTGDFEADFSKECAMATAYKKYIYPRLKMRVAEEWVRYDDILAGIPLIGRVDGIAEDGKLVEHKTTGLTNLDEYEYNLQWDEQILAYMLMTGARQIYYTICRKPNIRLKKGESEEDFFQRMCEWYDEDTDSKIRFLELTRTDEEIRQFREELEDVAYAMELAEIKNNFNDFGKSTSPYYRNTCYCNMWGRRCEYSSICLHYDPNQEYIEFKRREQK